MQEEALQEQLGAGVAVVVHLDSEPAARVEKYALVVERNVEGLSPVLRGLEDCKWHGEVVAGCDFSHWQREGQHYIEGAVGFWSL